LPPAPEAQELPLPVPLPAAPLPVAPDPVAPLPAAPLPRTPAPPTPEPPTPEPPRPDPPAPTPLPLAAWRHEALPLFPPLPPLPPAPPLPAVFTWVFSDCIEFELPWPVCCDEPALLLEALWPATGAGAGAAAWGLLW